jgi:DNA-binding response OmpR family regulator/DNA-binding transcriptional ArsR family regulator
MRVLIVDDNWEFREQLSAMLSDSGHSTKEAASAAVAINALEREEFDVMFTDIKTGRLSGIELLTLARKRWPRLIVVMLTGHATVETAVQALQLGAFDYIRKPIKVDQVHRVLGLISQQLALTRVGATPLDPVQYASALAAEGGYEVLLISPSPVEVPPEKVSHIPLDPDNPTLIREAVEDFVQPREKAAVVLAAVEELLARHREEDIAALLDKIREVLRGKGPLAVGYDPKKITATGALAVRASIVSTDAAATLDALSNPVRRLVLRRLAEGPCSFTQAMEAAHIDDTSLIAFHLRKLTSSGLITHLAREQYQLTPRGVGAISILAQIDLLDSGKGSGNRVFPSRSPKGKSSRSGAAHHRP